MSPRADWQSIPVPERMQKLQKDHRGYPVPANVLVRDGKPFFTINDDLWTWMRGIAEKRCPLCGDELAEGQYWFVGGPLSCFSEHGAFRDLPGHYECMAYALQVCPYLAMPSYGKRLDDKQLKHDKLAAQAGLKAYVDPTVLDIRPPFFGLCMADDYLVRPTPPTAAIIPTRPWKHTEVWLNGKRVEDYAEIMKMMEDYQKKINEMEPRQPVRRDMEDADKEARIKAELDKLNKELEPIRQAHESFKVNLPAAKSGEWEVDHFEVIADERQLVYVKQNRPVPLGRYTRLTHHGSDELFMTDTPAELNDASEFLAKAHGHVLITGLGIGMIPLALFNPLVTDWRKDVPPVTKITIVERSRDVINLVAGSMLHLPVDIIEADALEWTPHTVSALFDIAWHDIWPTISPDNLEEFARMREHYAPWMQPGAEQLCWAEKECLWMRDLLERGAENEVLQRGAVPQSR